MVKDHHEILDPPFLSLNLLSFCPYISVSSHSLEVLSACGDPAHEMCTRSVPGLTESTSYIIFLISYFLFFISYSCSPNLSLSLSFFFYSFILFLSISYYFPFGRTVGLTITISSSFPFSLSLYLSFFLFILLLSRPHGMCREAMITDQSGHNNYKKKKRKWFPVPFSLACPSTIECVAMRWMARLISYLFLFFYLFYFSLFL